MIGIPGLAQMGEAVATAFKGTWAQMTELFLVEHDEDGKHTDITAHSVVATANTETGATGVGTFDGDVTAQASDTINKCRIGEVGDLVSGASITSGLHLGAAKGWVAGLRLAGSPGTNTDYELRLWDLNHVVAAVSALRLFYYTANSWWTLGIETGGALALGEDASGKRLSEVNTIVARASTRTETGVLNLKTRTAPAQITANKNNYAINGGGRVFLTSDAARDITGILAGNDGEVLWIVNSGNFAITLKNNSGSSSAGNQLAGANASDVVLRPNNGSAFLLYDTTVGFWYVVGA